MSDCETADIEFERLITFSTVKPLLPEGILINEQNIGGGQGDDNSPKQQTPKLLIARKLLNTKSQQFDLNLTSQKIVLDILEELLLNIPVKRSGGGIKRSGDSTKIPRSFGLYDLHQDAKHDEICSMNSPSSAEDDDDDDDLGDYESIQVLSVESDPEMESIHFKILSVVDGKELTHQSLTDRGFDNNLNERQGQQQQNTRWKRFKKIFKSFRSKK